MNVGKNPIINCDTWVFGSVWSNHHHLSMDRISKKREKIKEQGTVKKTFASVNCREWDEKRVEWVKWVCCDRKMRERFSKLRQSVTFARSTRARAYLQIVVIKSAL